MTRSLSTLSPLQVTDMRLSTEDVPLIDWKRQRTTQAGEIYLADIARAIAETEEEI